MFKYLCEVTSHRYSTRLITTLLLYTYVRSMVASSYDLQISMHGYDNNNGRYNRVLSLGTLWPISLVYSFTKSAFCFSISGSPESLGAMLAKALNYAGQLSPFGPPT